MIRLCLLMVLCLLATVALAADPPKAIPLGSYRADKQKSWVIRFDKDNKFTVTSAGKQLAQGKYQATDKEVTLTDEAGPAAAQDDASKSGVYAWKLEEGKLTFRVVKDASNGRELVLTGNTWVLEKAAQ